MPLHIFIKLQNESPTSITYFDPTASSIKVAIESLLPMSGTFKATFNIANKKIRHFSTAKDNESNDSWLSI